MRRMASWRWPNRRAHLERSAGKPANLELAAKAADRTPASTPLAYEDDLGILVQWTPVDLALPAMAEPPERLREILEDAGVRTRVQDALPQLVHFKPNRRAVLRYGEHFVKIYADDKAYERAVAGMLAADALPMRSARLDAAIPELRLTAQSFVEGAPPAGPVEAAPAAGAFLAMLHGTPNETVRVTPPSHRLDSAGASMRLLASIEPRLESRLEALRRRLEEGAFRMSRWCSRTAISTLARCSSSTATTASSTSTRAAVRRRRSTSPPTCPRWYEGSTTCPRAWRRSTCSPRPTADSPPAFPGS